MIRPLVIALVVLAASPARAEMTLCNRTSYVMDAAIGIERNAAFSTRGWYRVAPGDCRKVVEDVTDGSQIYLHARTPDVYGTGPSPQGGQVDLCVGEGNFSLANARDCSNPVRFSAVRPVTTDKGPTATLGEEADYDYTQSRLAGIQRLLGIAGYDANPIDGVQGSKTTAALNKFLAEYRLPAGAPNESNFFDTLLKAAQNPEGHGFSWCNDLTTPVMAAIGVVELGAIVARGWYRIESGQCLRPDIRGNPLKVYSYAEAVDRDGRVLKRNGKPFAFGGTVMLCTRDGKFDLSDHKDCETRGLTPTGFVGVDLPNGNATTVRFKEP